MAEQHGRWWRSDAVVVGRLDERCREKRRDGGTLRSASACKPAAARLRVAEALYRLVLTSGTSARYQPHPTKRETKIVVGGGRTRGATAGMSLRAPKPTIDPELTSKYKGVFQLPNMAGTAPPVVYGKLSDSEFSLVATPAVEAGIPVSWKLQERKEAGHISLSIWKRDSKLKETILYGNGLPPLRR